MISLQYLLSKKMNVQPLIPLGSVIFDQKIIKQGVMQYINEEMLEALQSQTWLIKNGKYEKNHWKAIVPFIKQLKINQLIFYNNPQPLILKQIVCINFCQLKWLFLRKNKINNIEPLEWLSAPKLQKLILSNNEFSSVKPLQKLNLPKLSEIHINANPFKKVPLNCSKFALEIDCISFQEQESDRVIACDISDYAKTNFIKLKLLQTQGVNRIKQKKVNMALQRRFGSLKLLKQSKIM